MYIKHAIALLVAAEALAGCGQPTDTGATVALGADAPIAARHLQAVYQSGSRRITAAVFNNQMPDGFPSWFVGVGASATTSGTPMKPVVNPEDVSRSLFMGADQFSSLIMDHLTFRISPELTSATYFGTGTVVDSESASNPVPITVNLTWAADTKRTLDSSNGVFHDPAGIFQNVTVDVSQAAIVSGTVVVGSYPTVVFDSVPGVLFKESVQQIIVVK